ncbi:hypothetical protein CQ020_08960 [Arthrobacter sp. MYb23]|uniref:DUF3027 domain-containing protein n=1 Tax=unclassified Arthrobacter TaxID=235627 RepID=UPI000CFABF5F|nr:MULTISPECIES: DUF3027 domain-containing protein [unclassified Arthrobacter]PRB42732.1 hypothetical protein CQ038_09865 [Arthrobacter sp. MYb51]PRB96592.1 hypothetical protein CQ020_08960 [Arthrobacter sp. MYb23]
MTSESAQDTKAGPEAAQAPGNGDAPARKSGAVKSRTGLPVWRTGKPDAFLAAAVDAARVAVEGIANPGEVGAHLGAKSEGDRVVTHLFESRLAGYGGWQWYAVVTRNSRSKIVTVSELGLLPSEDSILAPEWVPWAKRVRPEDETPLVEETVEDVTEESVQAAEDEATESADAAADTDEDDADAAENFDGDEADDDETGAE